jgi:CBS domain-containing protein
LSVVIGLLASAAGAAAAASGLGVALVGILRTLAYINVLLAAFNLVPAFPLDGGRVLRAALWHRSGNFRRATRIASGAGSVFGMVLMVLGAVSAVVGLFVAGMWWFLIGMFLRGAARMSYEQAVLRDSLAGEPVRRFMHTDLRTVPAETTLGALVEEYFYRDYHKMYPVVDHGRLAGCVSIEQVKRVPREEWDSRTVSEVAAACSPENTIPADTDAVEALATMRRTGSTRLLVTEGDGLAGILMLKDLLGFLAVKTAREPG